MFESEACVERFKGRCCEICHEAAIRDPYSPNVSLSPLTFPAFSVTGPNRLSGQSPRRFFSSLRRRFSESYLTILYEAMNPSQSVYWNIAAASLLEVAEQTTSPTKGAYAQSAYALGSLDPKQSLEDFIRGLSSVQLHALRPYAVIWPEIRKTCLRCSLSLSELASAGICSACKRPSYCGRVCQVK